MPVTGDTVLYAKWIESNVPTIVEIKLPIVQASDPDRDVKRTVTFNYRQEIAESVKVNWGDSEELFYSSDIGVTTLTHTYEVSDEEELTYTISIYCPIGSPYEYPKFMFGAGYRYPFLACYNPEEPVLPDCHYITNVIFAPVVSHQNLDQYVLRGASITDLCLTPYINTLQLGCYEKCRNLKAHIEIPKSVKTILTQAFNNCTSIQTLTIANSVEHIGTSAFSHCSSLVTVNIDAEESHLKRIEWGAFSDCTSLTHFRLPRSLEVMGWSGINDGTTNDRPEGIETAEVFQNCPHLISAGPYNSLDHAGDPVTVEYPGSILNYFG